MVNEYEYRLQTETYMEINMRKIEGHKERRRETVLLNRTCELRQC